LETIITLICEADFSLVIKNRVVQSEICVSLHFESFDLLLRTEHFLISTNRKNRVTIKQNLMIKIKTKNGMRRN
jgi:hypothetical protein